MTVNVSYDDVSPIALNQSRAFHREPSVFVPDQLGGWLFFIDIIAITVAFILVHITFIILGHHQDAQHTATSLIGSAVVLIMMAHFGLYNFSKAQNRAREIKLLATSITLAFLFILAMSFTYAELRFSRIWYIAWYIYTLALVVICRFFAWSRIYYLAGSGRLKRRVAIYGSGQQASRLMEVLEQRGQPWIDIVGIFDDRSNSREDVQPGLHGAGNIADLISLCHKGKIDELLIAIPWSAEQRLTHLMSRLENIPARIRMAPDLAAFTFPQVDRCSLYGLSFLSTGKSSHYGFWAPIKTVEDYVLASILIIISSPFMVIFAIAIKLSSPGPVIFKQERHGLNNRLFKILKFRSMREHKGPNNVTVQATRNDPRVTAVGRFLRRTSLDEMPQLFNVIRGEMSLVGPRPHAADHNEYHGSNIARYFARHKVKPGMTGWAQVHGLRGEVDVPEKMQQRVQYDLEYIENWSIMLDFVILVRTFFVVFLQRTAY